MSFELFKDTNPFIFRLPQSWLVAFISEWLDFEERTIFDTAVSSHEHREYYLSCLRQLNLESDLSVYIADLQWFSVRQIPVRSVLLTCNVTRIQNRSNIYLPFLESLKVEFIDANEVIDQAILYLVRNSPNIQSIKLMTRPKVTDAGIQHIADFCPLLQDFYFCPWPNCSVIVSTLVNLFRRCSLLKEVSLCQYILENYSGTDLCQLKEFGHLFKSLAVFNRPNQDINAKDIVDFLLMCSNVEELDYTGVRSKDDSTMLQRLGEMCPMINQLPMTK